MYKEKIDLQGFETPFEMIRTKYSSRFQIIERRFVHLLQDKVGCVFPVVIWGR